MGWCCSEPWAAEMPERWRDRVQPQVNAESPLQEDAKSPLKKGERKDQLSSHPAPSPPCARSYCRGSVMLQKGWEMLKTSWALPMETQPTQLQQPQAPHPKPQALYYSMATGQWGPLWGLGIPGLIAPGAASHSSLWPGGQTVQRRRDLRLQARVRKNEERKTAEAGGEAVRPEGHRATVLGRGSLCLRKQPPGQFIVYFITLGCWALGQWSCFRQRS